MFSGMITDFHSSVATKTVLQSRTLFVTPLHFLQSGLKVIKKNRKGSLAIPAIEIHGNQDF
jgi:hypothetical protein